MAQAEIVDSPGNLDVGVWSAAQISFLCVLFGANVVAVKFAFRGYGVFASAGLRFFLAAVVICLWIWLSGRSFRLKPGEARHLLVFSIIFAAQMSLFLLGLDRTYASRGALLANLLPFFILVLAHFLVPGDRITWRKLIGLILGFSGVACIFLDGEQVAGQVRSGDLFVLGGTFLWACSTIYLKRVISSYHSYHFVLYPMLFSLPLFFAQSWLFDQAVFKDPTASSTVALLYQALISGSFAFIAWTQLLKLHGAVAMHTFVFIMPVAGVGLAGLILGEPIDLRLLVALALVVAGVLVVHLRSRSDVAPLRRGL